MLHVYLDCARFQLRLINLYSPDHAFFFFFSFSLKFATGCTLVLVIYGLVWPKDVG